MAALKGAERAVATVPGYSETHAISFAACSIAITYSIWFEAAFDALYVTQPPALLSSMLPTRALMLANTFGLRVLVVFITGRKYLPR